jgi:hypothetical protein
MQVESTTLISSLINIESLLSHFSVMMGPHGFYQHATLKEPLLREGYCVDDNARAVQFLLYLQAHLPTSSPVVEKYLQSCWQFLRDSQTEPGTYLNFRSAGGEWLSHDISDDMYARLVRAYTMALQYDANSERLKQAEQWLTDLLTIRVPKLQAIRAWSEIIVALAQLPRDVGERFKAADIIFQLSKKLENNWDAAATSHWLWFEELMTYANALMPHGMLYANRVTPTEKYTNILHDSTGFLMTTVIKNGMFIPVGSRGWYPKGGQPSIDNQQPIEAGMMFDFLLDYQATFPDRVTLEQLAAPYLWFWGHNTNKIVMIDSTDMSCMDGIFAQGPNPNCGGESLLAFLWSEIRLHTAITDIQKDIQDRKNRIEQ